MSSRLAFWILMLLWLVLGLLPYYPGSSIPAWPGHLLLFILFVLLGWKVFGSPISG